MNGWVLCVSRDSCKFSRLDFGNVFHCPFHAIALLLKDSNQVTTVFPVGKVVVAPANHYVDIGFLIFGSNVIIEGARWLMGDKRGGCRVRQRTCRNEAG